MPKRELTGTIVSDATDKTVIVEVESLKQHPKYLRRYRSHKKFKAHDEKNEYKKGDLVVILESRPISKDKRWRVIRKVQHA